jgi:hypothetical protein
VLPGFGMERTFLVSIQEKIKPYQREERDLDLMPICLVQFAILFSKEDS